MTLSYIKEEAQRGNRKKAEELLLQFFTELFALSISSVQIREDTLSLNSVNGLIHLNTPDPKSGSLTLFFKFHHEENEDGLKEYYNSQFLVERGFPVESPLYVSQEVGKQVLLYPLKTSKRLADLCKEIELKPMSAIHHKVIEAQSTLDKQCSALYLSSLHEATRRDLDAETILQLFYYRLVDDRKDNKGIIGGRYKQFYIGKTFEFPGQLTLDDKTLWHLKWRINGVCYKETLAEAFQKAMNVLSPAAHLLTNGTYPAIIAHGDPHNGNVWYNDNEPPSLSFFDPAFAGRHMPALLAEIKTTFHNIFAHPLWLYDAGEASRGLTVSCAIDGDTLDVHHDWTLSPLRRAFLQSKQENVWKPLLSALNNRGLLQSNWQDYMRAALFCCPTLVMNLRAHAGNVHNEHTPSTSLLGFAMAMMLSSAPENGSDFVADFFSELQTV